MIPQAKPQSDYATARQAIIKDLEARVLAGDRTVRLIMRAGVPLAAGAGEIKPCPVCGKGGLSYSRASNGHVLGQCDTSDCVAWME